MSEDKDAVDPKDKDPNYVEQDVLIDLPLPNIIISGRGTYTPPPPKPEEGESK